MMIKWGHGGEGSACVCVGGGAEEEVGARKRGVVVSEPHTEDTHFGMKADPPKRASFVKAHFPEY